MSLTAFEMGYAANSIYENPYWIDYPKKTCSKEEQRAACDWVFGYAQKIMDENNEKSRSYKTIAGT